MAGLIFVVVVMWTTWIGGVVNQSKVSGFQLFKLDAALIAALLSLTDIIPDLPSIGKTREPVFSYSSGSL